METNLKEVLSRLQKIQMDLAEIRSMSVMTSVRDGIFGLLSVTLYEPGRAVSFDFFEHVNRRTNEEVFTALLNYLNAEEIQEIHKDIMLNPTPDEEDDCSLCGSCDICEGPPFICTK